ncbi:MAG: hypothetical protein ACLUKN_10075 [Bacilli bacterium]
MRQGVVHIAPGHGLEDYQVGLENGLDIYSPINDEGCYVDDGMVPAEPRVKRLRMKRPKPGYRKSLELLERNGALLHSAYTVPPLLAFKDLGEYLGNGPVVCCAGCYSPKQALEAISTVEWVPARGEIAYGRCGVASWSERYPASARGEFIPHFTIQTARHIWMQM